MAAAETVVVTAGVVPAVVAVTAVAAPAAVVAATVAVTAVETVAVPVVDPAAETVAAEATVVDPVTATEMAARAETAAARAVISAMARGQVHNHKIKIRCKPRPICRPSLSSRCRNNHKFTPRQKRRPRPQPNLKRNCITTIRPRLRSRPNLWSKRPVPMARMTAQKAATTNKGQIDEYRIDRGHPPVPLSIFPAVTKPDPATGSIGRSILGLALYKIPLSPYAKGEPLEVHSAFLAAFPQSRGIQDGRDVVKAPG